MKANEPAYLWEQSPGNQSNLGLTKREYFAAMAMQGAIGADKIFALKPEHAASYGVRCADALIAELSK